MAVLAQQVAGRRATGRSGFGRLRLRVRGVAFAAIGLFILLAPAAFQVFGVNHLLLRPWIMYSGAGIGLLKGEFRIAEPGRPVAVRTPLQLLGLDRYPFQRHYEFDRRVFEPGDLKRFAAEACAKLPAGATLSFDGVVGTRDGWKPLHASDVCALDAPATPWEAR